MMALFYTALAVVMVLGVMVLITLIGLR